MDDLFKAPKILPGKASQRRFTTPLPTKSEEETVIKKGRDYVNVFIQQERRLFEEQSKSAVINEKPEHSSLSNVDSFTNVTSMNDNADMKDDKSNGYSTYERYLKKKSKCNENLPIYKDREDILRKIRTNKVLIIKGQTGCGKTTQVPQFIFDDAVEKKESCNIVVTQPRRIAAMTVAKRVCEERGCELGTLVGYQIGLDRKFSEDTRILYCTTGVLLEKLISSKKLTPFTHVLLDEVHERDQDMDFLLLIAKRLVNTNSRDVKVILMSATLDTTIFSEYFYTISNNQKIFPPTQSINEKSLYKIRIYYIDDIKLRIPDSTGICPEKDNPEINKKGYKAAVRLVEAFDTLEMRESHGKDPVSTGSVLIFLPGMHEIEEMHKTINDMEKDIKCIKRWKVYPLHSSITYEEQKAAFRQPADGERKIILSTNITESSVTVSDMKYVIDFCLTKSLVKEPFMNFCSLKLEWASKNSLDQRAGRVGRVSDGRVYRLVTKNFYNQLDQEPEPEIKRCPLDQLVLKAKLLDMGEPHAILALALDQPDFENIEKTICQLKLIGALKVTVGRKLSAYDGDLTFLGQVIAKLPMDCHLGKLIFLGHLFNVTEECIVMACSMATKPMFSNPFQEYLQAYNSKLAWADSSCSDCIAFCNAYKLWRKKSIEGHFRNNTKINRELKWSKDRFVEIRTLREIAMLEADVNYRLKNCGVILKDYKKHDDNEKPKLNPAQKALFLKLAIAGAFFPNYFLRGTNGGQIDEREAYRVLNGHNPYTTVYLQGMPNNQPRLLYKKSIQKKFESVSRNANVIFDSCSKVFVDFGETIESQRRDNMCLTIPGKVDMAVYRAIKMGRQPEYRFNFFVLNPQLAQKRYDEWMERRKEPIKLKQDNIGNLHDMEWPWNKLVSPNLKYTQHLKIEITQFQSPFRFWAQSSSKVMKLKLQDLIREINIEDNLKKLTSEPVPGKMYAGRYNQDCKFYRCRMVSEGYRPDTYKIFFVDYGNYQSDVLIDDLREFESEFARTSGVEILPYFAVEFRLAKVKPLDSITDSNTKEETNMLFRRDYAKFYIHKKSIATVYSHVKDVVHVKLSLAKEIINEEIFGKIQSFNDFLVFIKFAEKTDESYMSIRDHVERKKWSEMANDYANTIDKSKLEVMAQELDAADLEDIDSPTPNECTQEMYLKGPYSPLEMKVFGCTQCSVAKTVKIEQNSVNSVLLDTDPADSHERMLVSAFVGTNETGDRLTLRHTTVMPNLPGLPVLVILLFSPMVELRSNSCNTKLSGALCGLGYDVENGAPLFGDQDIELVFDVEITLNHIIMINKIRFWLNQASCSSDEIPKACKTLPVYLDQLFRTKFELQELYYNIASYQWNRIPEKDLLDPMGKKSPPEQNPLNRKRNPSDDISCVFRLIWGISLDGREHEQELREKVIRNINRLREFTRLEMTTTTGKSFICELCQVELTNPVSAKLHLKGYQHKVREARFDIPNESKSISTASSMMSLDEMCPLLNAMYPPTMPSSSVVNYNRSTNSHPRPNQQPTKSLPLNCFVDRTHISRKPQ